MRKLSQIITLTILFFLSLSLSCTLPKLIHAENSEVYVNDLVLKENDVWRDFENKSVVVNGNIIIMNNATLLLTGTTLTFNWTTEQYYIKLFNASMGHPRITAIDSTIDAMSQRTNATTHETIISSVKPTVPISVENGTVILTNVKSTYSFNLLNGDFEAYGRKTDLPIVTGVNSTLLISGNRKPITKIDLTHSNVTMSDGQAETITAKYSSSAHLLDSGVNTLLNLFVGSHANLTRTFAAETTMTNATAAIINCTIVRVQAMGTSNATIEKCKQPATVFSVELFDQAMLSLVDSDVGTISIYNSSQATIDRMRMEGVISYLQVWAQSKADVRDSVMDNAVVSGTAELAVKNSTVLRVTASENSNLTMTDAIILSWVGTYDNAVAKIFGSRNDQKLSSQGASRISIYDSELKIVDVHDSSQMLLSNSSATILTTYESSKVDSSRCRLTDVNLIARSVNGSIEGFKTNSIIYWNFAQNNSIQLSKPDGSIPDLTLRDMPVPSNISLHFTGSSNLTITDATLSNIEAAENTYIRLNNCSADTYSIVGRSRISSYWYITVKVLDSQKSSVAGAGVTILDPQGYLVESGKTDSNGNYKSPNFVLASVINGTQVESTLILEIEKGDYFVRKHASDFTSGNIIIKLAIPLPWWQTYWYIFAIVLMLALAFILLFVVYKKIQRRIKGTETMVLKG